MSVVLNLENDDISKLLLLSLIIGNIINFDTIGIENSTQIVEQGIVCYLKEAWEL